MICVIRWAESRPVFAFVERWTVGLEYEDKGLKLHRVKKDRLESFMGKLDPICSSPWSTVCHKGKPHI